MGAADATGVAAHALAVRTGPTDMAALLQDLLGQRLVAVITAQRDPKNVGRWLRGDRAPNPAAAAKLRQTYQVASLLLQREDPRTVAQWFSSMNPYLDDDEPAIALREGRAQEVIRAARAFLAGAGS